MPGVTLAGLIEGEQQLAALCASAKVIIGIDNANDCDRYFSNRTWITLGCGGFLLTQYVPGLEELFDDGVQLASYKTFEECADKVAYYVAHDEERRRIASAGYALVHEKHTYDQRTREMLDVLARCQASGAK
jgi:spore maturation protein CgeB